MRYLCTAVTIGVVTLAATTAAAQLGLYGAPAPIGYQQPAASPLPYGQPAGAAAQPHPQGYAAPYASPYGSQAPVYSASTQRPAEDLPREPAPPTAPGAQIPATPSPSDAPNPVERMLDEVSGNSCYAPASCGPVADCDGGGPFAGCEPVGCETGWLRGAVGRFERACGLGGDTGCGDACGVGCGPAPCPAWYASVSALTLTRDKPNKVWTSYETGNEPNQLFHTAREMSYEWGGEIRMGRKFCCDPCTGGYRFGLEYTYWTVNPMESSFVGTHPSGVSTALTVGQVEFDGTSATAWFDAALEHRLRREDEIHSSELTLISYSALGGRNSPWNISFSGGFRYFHFDERLVFGTLADPNNLPVPGTTPDEAFIDEDITNDLYGFQFGLRSEYCLLGRFSVFAEPKFGIYNNHIEHTFRMYLEDGTVADTGSSGVVGTYPVRSDDDVLSFLTQIDLGCTCYFTPRLSASLGYRVVAITGIGLADNQIPPYAVDIPEIADIDHNGDLILHGAFANLMYAF